MIAWVVIDRRQLRHSTPIPSSPLPQNLCTRFTLSPKSLSHNPFADPHPINPVVSILYKNNGRWGLIDAPPYYESVAYNTITLLPTIRPRNSFSCNTYRYPRKCCKQKTYVRAKPFRCNTYKKPGGVPPSSQM